MRLFCDQCGTEFGATTLRADSKFCSICGKALSDYVKQQCGNLFNTALKHPQTADNAKTYEKKRKNVDLDEEEESSTGGGHGKTRERPSREAKQANGADTTDETSTEENPGSEQAEIQGLGKGKRIRKTTQRYVDEVDPTSAGNRLKTTVVTPIKKSNSSLEQILNSAPTSGTKPSLSRATESVPLRLAEFKLGSTEAVPERAQARRIKREAMARVLGGSLKTTFPYPRNRREGPTYACLKESEHDYLPKNPGEHAILVLKSLPESLDKSGFTLFIKSKKTNDWTYCGKYKVLHTFAMSKEQWAAMGDRTKAHKVSGTLRSAWGKDWCVERGVDPDHEGMMEALNMGILSWQVNVIECIGYDVKLAQQLLKA